MNPPTSSPWRPPMPPLARRRRPVVQSRGSTLDWERDDARRQRCARENDMRHAEEDALRRRKEEEKYHNHATHVKVSAAFSRAV
mmetsp:Transcript_1343/g.4228  ORF Transcript_1343/g.4228 Transcript_1343/m.4228 type:complete len:84 (+) Transcript_1343:1364-1615(+)